jgi:PncC family amidohydrolase
VERLCHQQLGMAVAESLTGGLLALRVTETPDSGQIFRGAVVAYLTGVKHELLGVPEGPVVSAKCAEAMAEGVAALLDADVSIATTGVAGPEPQEDQPVGTVFIGYRIDGRTDAERLDLSNHQDPHAIREATVDAACNGLLERLRS